MKGQNVIRKLSDAAFLINTRFFKSGNFCVVYIFKNYAVKI